jgi:hypothetical protein
MKFSSNLHNTFICFFTAAAAAAEAEENSEKHQIESIERDLHTVEGALETLEIPYLFTKYHTEKFSLSTHTHTPVTRHSL